LKVRKWLRETFGDNEFVKWVKDSEGASKAFKIIGGGLIGMFVAIGAAAVVLAFQVGMFLLPVLWGLAAPFIPFIAAAVGVGAAITSLVVYWDELVQAIKDVDLGQLIMDAILLALDPFGVGRAMVNLAGTMIDSFKKAIGAHSPAKAFIKVGATIPEGVAEGVHAGAPEAQEATADMVDASAPKLGRVGAGGGSAPPAAGAAAGRLGGGAPITIGEIHIHATSDKPQALAMDFRRELERVLAGFASELGAPEPA
jgi:hypothetical protein